MKTSLMIIFFSLLVSCSKHDEKIELKYTIIEIENLLHESSPSHETGHNGLTLSDYSPGVNHLESRALVYKKLSFFAVSFDTEEHARLEAIRLNQYYSRNWLFDQVEGEPMLEDYIIQTFKGTNPNRSIQRIPKKSESANGEIHGQTH